MIFSALVLSAIACGLCCLAPPKKKKQPTRARRPPSPVPEKCVEVAAPVLASPIIDYSEWDFAEEEENQPNKAEKAV